MSASPPGYFELRQVDPEQYADFATPVWIRRALALPGTPILDYGCGLGQFLDSLKRDGYTDLSGVDIEAKAIEACTSKGHRVLAIDPLHPRNPYGRKFGAVIMSHVLEHVPKDGVIPLLAVLRTEFLVPGGQLLIAVPNAQSNTGPYWRYEDWTHYGLFTSGSLVYVGKAAGFQNIRFEDVDCTDKDGPVNKIIRKFLLRCYAANKRFWNKVTCSYYHAPSPVIYSYEIKCILW